MAFIGIGSPMLWRVGFAVAWLVGSWLFGPKQKKNDIFDPGAQEMPRWNTALRGIIIPVLFGTNRVSSQIVWQHDYTVVRNEKGDSGGGKVGGSGGGKGAAQTGSISYNYYWDLLYHLGMTPEPYTMIKGWVGAERMNNDAVSAIVGDSGGVFVFADVKDPNRKEEDKVRMTFEDSFYFDGYGPVFSSDSSSAYDGWSELLADEGIPVRWPHTVYVGFKQLALGEYPSVPQMSFEIGPQKSTVEYDNQLKASLAGDNRFAKKGNEQIYTLNHVTAQGQIEVHKFLVTSEEQNLVIYEIDLDTQDVTLCNAYDETIVEAMMASYTTYVDSVSYMQAGIIAYDDQCRIVLLGTHVGGTSLGRMVMQLATLDVDGNLSIAGSFSYVNIFIGSYVDKLLHVFVANGQTANDPIVTIYNQNAYGSNQPIMTVWPSPALLDGVDDGLTTTQQISAGNAFGFLPLNWNFNLEFIYGFGNLGKHNSYRRFESFFWTIPKYRDVRDIKNPATPNDLYHPLHPLELKWRLETPEFGTYLYWYVSYADLLYGDLPTNAGGSQTTPQIAVLKLDYIWWKDPRLIGDDAIYGTYYDPVSRAPEPVFYNDIIKTYNKVDDDFPFDDANLYEDGVTTDPHYYGDYDPSPSVHRIINGVNAGVQVITFAQQLPRNGQAEGGTASPNYLESDASYFRARVYAWDPIMFQTDTKEPPWPDNGSPDFYPRYVKVNEVASNGYSQTRDIGPRSTCIFYLEENNALYYATQVDDYSSPQHHSYYIGQFGVINLSGGKDVTPPYIVYQILTSQIFGIGLTVDQIDTASYGAAVSYCEANNFYVSVQYRREDGVLQIIDDLLSVYGGFLVISNGVVKFKQLQYLDGLQTSVRTIDNSHLISKENGKPPVNISKAARQDTFNKVRVNYFDRNLEYAQNQVEEADEVDQDLNGIRPREFPAIFVMEEAMARQMALRALWSNLYSRDTYEFSLGWKDSDLEPGDVITLVDSYHQSLQGGVTARIIEWRERERGKFDVTAKQEFEYILSTSASALNITSASIINRINEIPTIRDFTMYELPRRLNTNGMAAYVSWASYEFAAGATLYLSPDGETYSAAQDISPYQLNGIFMDGLPNDPAMVENVNILMAPRSDWISTGSVYYNTTLADTNQAIRSRGAALMWCGSEMLAYQGLTLVAQNQYRIDKLFRGWGGTHIHAHNSGDVWYKQGAGIFINKFMEDQIGTDIYYKVVPKNLGNFSQNVSSVNGKYYVFQGQDLVANIPGAIEFVNSGTNQRGKVTHDVDSGSDINIRWPDTMRTGGYGTRGYGKFEYGRSAPVNDSYRVTVVGSGGTQVHSQTVSSAQFTYPASTNIAENGAWRSVVAFQVTPYNSDGDSYETSVLSLELW